MSTFGTQNVKIIIFENFVIDPFKSLQEVLTFLDIELERSNFKNVIYEQSIYPRYIIGKHFINFVRQVRKFYGYDSSATLKKLENVFFTHKRPKMYERDRILLKNYFKEVVKKLEDILGSSLPWRNFRIV